MEGLGFTKAYLYVQYCLTRIGKIQSHPGRIGKIHPKKFEGGFAESGDMLVVIHCTEIAIQ